MAARFALEVQVHERLLQLAQELYQFLANVEKPRVADLQWSREIFERCKELEARAAAARDALSARLLTQRQHLRRSLDDLSSNLRTLASELDHKPSVQRLRGLSAALARNYEELLAQLRAAGKSRAAAGDRPLHHVKTTNPARHLFHALSGLACVFLYEKVLSHGQAMAVLLSVLGLFTGLELSRRAWPRWNDFLVDRVFGHISRPWERHRVNASTWYLLALTLIVATLPPVAFEVAILVLAFGDPAASLAGKRWGRHKLWRERTVEGTGAFFAVSLAVSTLFLLYALPGWPLPRLLGLALSVSATGAVTELLSTRLEDNFTIPVLCALTAWLWI